MPSLARDLLYRILPKPVARNRPRNSHLSATNLLVISKGRNPTFSYYLEERLTHSPLPAQIRDLTQRLDDIEPQGLFVIICRYIRPRQLFWLYRNRDKLAGVALLVDDDLAANIAAEQSNITYKAYVAMLGILPLPILNRTLTDTWVSTPALAEAIGKEGGRITLIEPFPPSYAYTSRVEPVLDERRPVTMAFHATGIHDAEHRFLVPIVREALRLSGNLHFQVVASGQIEQLWMDAQLPQERFTLLPNRSWTSYLEETSQQHVDISLVPLLPSRVNDVRSSTKRFDVARMGAAAIFSRCEVYQRHANKGEILTENDSRLWVDSICRLAGDAGLRERTREATADAVRKLIQNTSQAFPIYSTGTGRKDFCDGSQ